MESMVIGLFSVCIVIGIVITVETMLKIALKRAATPDHVRFYVRNRSADIEVALRMMLYKNPALEITVVDCASQDQTAEIIRQLAQDCPRLHLETTGPFV